jgi:hypothetical protein
LLRKRPEAMLERQGHYTSSHKRSSTVGTTYRKKIKLEALLVGWSEATVTRPGPVPGPVKVKIKSVVQ